MKGQILGFDGTTGAITGEDGERYAFDLAEWKGDKAPQPRDTVDFVARDGMATEIYKVGSAVAAPSLDSIGASLSGFGSKIEVDSGKLEYLRTRPKLIFIGLAIFSFFFLNMVVLGREGYSALSLPSNLEDAGAIVGLFSGNDAFDVASTFAYVMWLVPLLGGFAIFREVTGKRSRKAELGTAIVCLCSVLVYALVIGAFEATGNSYSRGFDEILAFGFGGWLFVLCGIGLLLTTFGIVKTVPGWPAPVSEQAES